MKKIFCAITLFITALCIVVSTISSTVSAYSEDTKEILAISESDTEDRQAVAGAHNDNAEVTVPAKKIKLKNGSLHKLDIGETIQIDTSLSPSNSDDYITYKSMNTNVALVDKRGCITAVGSGTATVRLKTSSGVKVNVVIEVSETRTEIVTPDTKVEEITLSAENLMLRSGDTAVLDYILFPIGTVSEVTFESENNNIASVSADGKVKAHDAGSTIITIKTSSGVQTQCTVTVYTGVYHGIDVSKWQGDINWKEVKKHGVDFVMIRSSFGDCDVDEKLKVNVKGCEKYDIPYGFYHYTYARNVNESKKEAKFFLNTIKNYSPEYPVVLDIEESFYERMSKKQVTDIICTFVEELEAAGYYAMIYSNAKFFEDNTVIERLKDYDIWVACWGDEEKLESSYSYHYGMWQYTDDGEIPGIDENEVDLNYAYKNYAERIRRFGLNNLD